MKRAISVLLSAVLIVGLGLSSIGAVAPWLSLGRKVEISGTVNKKTSSVKISATAYPEQAQGMFNEINRIRREAGLTELIRDPNLSLAAQQRALEITEYMSHTRPDGTNWATVNRYANGENLGINMEDYIGTTTGFMNSPPHKANILDKDYTSLQVYCLERNSELYWVQLFGTAKTTTPGEASGGIMNKSNGPTTNTPTTSEKPTTTEKPANTEVTTEDIKLLPETVLVDLAEKSVATNGVKIITANNPYAIQQSSLTAMQKAVTDSVTFRADTIVDKAISGRLTIKASTIKDTGKTILLGVGANNKATENTKEMFSEWFENKIVVISLAHQGDFGGTVRVAAKIDLTELSTKALIFYTFDKATNKYSLIKDVTYFIDDTGYLQFDTTVGGDIIITDAPLSK